MEQAGTFEFYGVDDNQALCSFIAAQCTPTATQESVIDSPSTLELTCRYCYLQSLIEHSKLKPEVTEELRSFRRAAVRDESEEGCMHDGESYKVLGQAFGKVREISTSYKIGVLEQHNELLRKVHSTCFELPSYAEVKKAEARSAEIKGAEASSVTAQVSSAEASSARTLSISEWCCFEVEKDRFGRNEVAHPLIEPREVKGVKPGTRVSKAGRTTGRTEGRVNGCIVQIWSGPDYGVTIEIGVVGEVAGEDFGRPGDSGSLVTMEGSDYELYGVGVLPGLGEGYYQMVAIVTPQWAIS